MSATAPAAADVPQPRLLEFLLGLLLHHLLLLVQESSGEVVAWYNAQVSLTTLQDQVSTALLSKSDLESAVMVSVDQTTHQLFCCTDDSTCSLYDLAVSANHDDSASGPIQNCWTWYTGESHRECEDSYETFDFNYFLSISWFHAVLMETSYRTLLSMPCYHSFISHFPSTYQNEE